MSKKHPGLVQHFMDKLGINLSQMTRFLDISHNTLYNYRIMEDDKLPKKSVEKILNFLNVRDFEEAHQYLERIERSDRSTLSREFVKDVSAASESESLPGNERMHSRKPNRIGSETYRKALQEEILKVINGPNDYEFISYIQKYRKRK